MFKNDEKEELVLRPMVLADLDQVAEIDRASFPTPWPKGAFLYEIKRQRNAVCWVAEITGDDGQKIVAAAIVVWLIVDEAHIGTLAVKPGYRRHKIAQRLLARSLIESHQRGAHRAMLEVRKSNQAAQNLYQKCGFEAVGLRKDYYKDTHEDAILMTLEEINPRELARLMDAG